VAFEEALSTGAVTSTLPEKCPNCGGQLGWQPESGQLCCESCKHLVPVPVAMGARVVEHDLEQALDNPPPRGSMGAGARQMKCSECGAVVEFPDHVTALRCEFCDSPAVLAQPATDDHYLPESVVPFAVGRDASIADFRGWLGKLWFRPSDLKHKADVAELHGVYVPYWTFDATVHSTWTADAGYHYYETEHYTDANGNRQTRQVQRTRWVPAAGQRSDAFDDHLVCASQGLPDAMAVKMANFATAALVPYARPLMQGFSAESYAIDLKPAWSRAQDDLAQVQERRCADDVPGDTHRFLRVSNTFDETTFKHVLLPVWIAAFRYNGKVYRFLVNGQTGNVSGNAPYSILKITLFVLMCLGLVAAAILLWLHVEH
jgi:hypothetical protein